MAQLQNKMYICRKNEQLQNTFIAVLHFLAILKYYFSLFLSLLVSTLPRHLAMVVQMKLPPAEPPPAIA
jgi:hypothetical protein